jgi:NhaA family Na+:H+ antiporter
MSSESNSHLKPGLIMIGAAFLALILANSPLADGYQWLVQLPIAVSAGGWSLGKPLVLWVNEALMATFFLLIGIEINRELVIGSLRSARQAALPAAAAAGGMLGPALVFWLVVGNTQPEARGWAVPCATDIAFSIVVLRLALPQVSITLITFLTAIAVLDDLGAIVIIAVFYASNLSTTALLAALVPIAALVVLNRRGVSNAIPYLLAGVVLWFCVLKSGVHATLAGAITAMAMPVATQNDSSVDRVEQGLHTWVNYWVLPAFALFNAGVSLAGIGFSDLMAPVPLGIASGLLVGKTLGIAAGTALGIWLLRASLPAGSSWRQIFGLAAMAGIGFTMSLFIASLAYEEATPQLFDSAKIGILLGSVLAALLGVVLLRWGDRSRG